MKKHLIMWDKNLIMWDKKYSAHASCYIEPKEGDLVYHSDKGWVPIKKVIKGVSNSERK